MGFIAEDTIFMTANIYDTESLAVGQEEKTQTHSGKLHNISTYL